MSDTIRTFIAIDTPPEFKIRAERVQEELGAMNAPVRWEKTYKLHLTLKFLGDTPAEMIDTLDSQLKGVLSVRKPFWLRYSGLGCFPNPKNPRIIWIGCNPLSSDLDHLQESVESVCAGLGFERETRAFHPHITIGRVKVRSGKDKKLLPDLIKKMENVTFDPIEDEVHTILLIKSELRPGGSIYSILRQISLSP